MADHTEILEAALSELDEGIIVLDGESHVLFWSPAATAMAGYVSSEVLGRGLPEGFYQVDTTHHGPTEAESKSEDGSPRERPVLVNLCHQRGHTLPAMMHRSPLRNVLGKRFGTLLRFHTVDEIDTLLHGESSEDSLPEHRLEQSQAGLEDRLEEACREWLANGVPYGLIWVLIDQAAALRRTHGRDASEAMINIVEKTLLHGLRPTEILGRWGSNEFLVLSHERTVEMLDAHGRYLAGLTRTADFRWWGDRASLTVSIGVAQAETGESLSCLLKRAQKAMEKSQYNGGNCVTSLNPKDMANTGGQECSQS
jgi:PAS domain S-box-containing protein/diguanylate cyclase (GGDEF)-like protein